MFNPQPQNILDRLVLTEPKKLDTKAKLLFNLSLQSTQVQSVSILQVLMERRKLVTRMKLLFNPQPQNTQALSVLMEHKNLDM